MKETGPTRQLSPPSLKAFREFVGKIIAVPKSEIDTEEEAYQKKRKAQKPPAKSTAPSRR